MESIGQILKSAREHQGRSIAEAAEAIKAKQMIIHAIEANDFEELIAPVYARGFIKLYAEYLGLNPQPLLQIYRRQSEQPAAAKAHQAIPPRSAKPRYGSTAPSPAPATTMPAPEPKETVARQEAPAKSAVLNKPAAPDRPPTTKNRRFNPPQRIPKPPRKEFHWNWERIRGKVDLAGMLGRLSTICRTGLSRFWQVTRAVGVWLAAAADTSRRRLMLWLRTPHGQRAVPTLAVVLMIVLISMALRQAWFNRRAQYTPPPQYGRLQPPPDPYP
ncbi:MAG: helix-turn-helix domain-containing protein [Kiritimatiellia bacterium]|jgi:hypothetical protein